MGVRLLVLLCSLCGGALSSSTQPNIIILFADDLGYGDPSYSGHPTSSSPNIDHLASEGLVFTQFYTGAPVCSPSRATLLTGRFFTRSGIYPGVFAPNSIGGLPLNETTIAEGLKTVGYSTAIIGKWHLGVGHDNMYLPTNQGFDYYMGIPYSNDMCPCLVCFYPDLPCAAQNRGCGSEYTPCPVFENTKIVQQPADFLTLTSTYINSASSFIKSRAAQGTPFFLYMAFQHTHRPQFAGKVFTNSSIRGPFGDALAELDWGVGQLLEAIRDSGVEKETFVFFTSDNGPSLKRERNGGNQGLLRCGKGTTWEGGVRVPGIAYWPGRIQPGKSMEVAATVDLFPTILNLAGAKLPSVTLDGLDMSPLLFEGKSYRDFFPFYSSNTNGSDGAFAFRLNQYKAHFITKGGLCNESYPDMVCRGNYTKHEEHPPLLYNLNSDPSEVYNLNTTDYSNVLATLEKAKADYDAGMVWGESEIHRGKNSTLEPCAKPGCSPFPTCCRTDDLIDHMTHSRAV